MGSFLGTPVDLFPLTAAPVGKVNDPIPFPVHVGHKGVGLILVLVAWHAGKGRLPFPGMVWEGWKPPLKGCQKLKVPRS